MASGKHSRGKRKRKRSQPRNVSAADLLNQVRQLLARGDGRGALDRLRQAPQGGGGPKELPLLRFCAGIERARQLTRSGLGREAASMRAQAARHRASISVEAAGDEDLILYIRCLDGADALAVYAESLASRPASPRVERVLADLLVIRRCWRGLDALDAGNPLRRDAEPVMRSLDAMDAGDWGRAATLLQGVPRRSPFAPWRVFCKAMTCFGAGDDRGLRRCLELLPADFALAHTVAEWRRLCTGEGEGGPVRVRQALGTAGSAVEALGGELREALLRGNERPRVLERLITDLADALCPRRPFRPASICCRSPAWRRFGAGSASRPCRRWCGASCRPSGWPGVSARTGLALQQASPDLWDPAPAATFLDRLDVELPRAEDHALARGRVLETLARSGHRAVEPDFLPPRMVKALSGLLGGLPDPPDTLSWKVFVELMAASLDADPRNREGYRFLLDLLRGRRNVKPRIRSVLERMAASFPDDPEPWLELATLHYSGNAYRRAEQALAEAKRRAPHDERILDLQAIGFLKSADQSRKGGRFELAASDLRHAEDLDRAQLRPILHVKRILLDLVSGARADQQADHRADHRVDQQAGHQAGHQVGHQANQQAGQQAGQQASQQNWDVEAVVASHLERLAPAGALRTIALLLHDLRENRRIRNVPPEMESTVTAMLARRASVIDALDSGEIVELLAPLPFDLHILYRDLHIAPVLTAWWAGLVRRLDGDGVPAVFDILMDCGGRAAVRAEIVRRLRIEGKTRRDPLLLLYLAMIRHLEGQDFGARRFVEAVEAAAPSDLEPLKAAAARLARHARGILREALRKFDFTLLDLPPPLFGDGVPSGLSDLLERLFDASEPDPDPDLEPEPDETSLDEFMDALRDGLSDAVPGDRRQGSLFDSETASELDAFEDLLDRHAMRGAPASLLQEVAGVARAEPEIRQNLDRMARGCEAAGLRPGLSREAKIFLFPRRRGKGRH